MTRGSHPQLHRQRRRHGPGGRVRDRSPCSATPRLLAWCEAATCAAIEPALSEGATSVGTRMTLEHLAASPVGQEVEVTASSTYVDGRLHRFTVAARHVGRQREADRHRRRDPGGRRRRAVPVAVVRTSEQPTFWALGSCRLVPNRKDLHRFRAVRDQSMALGERASGTAAANCRPTRRPDARNRQPATRPATTADFVAGAGFERMAVGPHGPTTSDSGGDMGKTGRKRRARKKKGANHGKRPNA